MKRCIIALLASLLANLVGFLVPSSAIAPSTGSVITYAYDSSRLNHRRRRTQQLLAPDAL